MILAQVQLNIIGLLVQAGFAGLCGYMVYAQEKKARREAAWRDTERKDIKRVLAEKDKFVRDLVDSHKELLMKSIQAQERSTEVSRQVVEVIKRCVRV